MAVKTMARPAGGAGRSRLSRPESRVRQACGRRSRPASSSRSKAWSVSPTSSPSSRQSWASAATASRRGCGSATMSPRRLMPMISPSLRRTSRRRPSSFSCTPMAGLPSMASTRCRSTVLASWQRMPAWRAGVARADLPRAVRAGRVALGDLGLHQLVVNRLGLGVGHRRRCLGAGVHGGATAAVGEGDGVFAALRFDGGVVNLVGAALAVVEGDRFGGVGFSMMFVGSHGFCFCFLVLGFMARKSRRALGGAGRLSRGVVLVCAPGCQPAGLM